MRLRVVEYGGVVRMYDGDSDYLERGAYSALLIYLAHLGLGLGFDAPAPAAVHVANVHLEVVAR